MFAARAPVSSLWVMAPSIRSMAAMSASVRARIVALMSTPQSTRMIFTRFPIQSGGR